MALLANNRYAPRLLLVFCGLIPRVAGAEEITYAELKKLVRASLKQGEVDVRKPVFKVKDGFLTFRPGNALFVPDPEAATTPNVWRRVYSERFRVELIKQQAFYKKTRGFFDPLFARVEPLIKKQLSIAQSQEIEDEKKYAQVVALSEKINSVYKQEKEKYAKARGLGVTTSFGYAPPWNVKLISEPKGARIFLLHAVERRVAKMRKQKPRWKLIRKPAKVELQGKYYFMLQWGDKTKVSDKPIHVNREGIYTLR